MEEEDKSNKDLLEARKEKLSNFFKKKGEWVFYALLALIIALSVFIRTRNFNNLKDITTNTWTLGPDLDPYLFLRWAEYIVEHGKLMVMDMMRYVPLGYNTSNEMKLLSYMIAYFYHFLSLFSKQMTVTLAAIIFPVFMFALTCIAFFFLTKEIFKDTFEDKKIPNIIALIATLFLAIIPSLLPRTIAGIPEKESAGFLFIFLALFLIIKSFKSKTYTKAIIYGVLAGISTAVLALIWGGVLFVYVTVGIATFIYFLLGYINKKEFSGYSAWIIVFILMELYFSTRYSIESLIISTSTMPIHITWLFILVSLFIYPKISNINFIKKFKEKIHFTREMISMIIAIILLILLSIVIFGPGFIPEQASHLTDNLVRALGTNRFSLTVAENRQPYFDEWKYSFGPVIGNIPLFFWLFIIGSVIFLYNIMKKLEKKERWLITISYFIFIIGLIFSRYSAGSIFDGTSIISLVVYFGSIILFFSIFGYIIYKYNKEGKKELLKIEIGEIVIFVLFFVCVLAGRSGVRFIMMLVPPTSIIVAYLVVISVNNSLKTKDETFKAIIVIFAIIIVVAASYTAFVFYNNSVSQAASYYPGDYYQRQWQKAMAWVRTETPENAVFAHWWDYGYWVQSIGKRATVLDGGNAVVYWDHLMGRNVLTTPDDKPGLEFLYAHNATHLLIDPTDIGKYSAFSSIGADENYDRFSYIPTFFLDLRSTKETPTGRTYYYPGVVEIDEDIVWKNNNSEQNFPKETTAVRGIIIEEDLNGTLLQPQVIFIQSNSNQLTIPIRYVYHKNKLYNFNSGLEAGFFIMPSINQESSSLIINDKGAGLYLSKRTVNSLLARKYLFGQEGDFKLVHSEQNNIIEQIRMQGNNISDFAYFGGNLLGPIKIWEIKYPKDIKFNADYLKTEYPNEALWKPQ